MTHEQSLWNHTYFKQIKKNLPDKHSQIALTSLSNLRNSISIFLEENPNCTASELDEVFGTPIDFINSIKENSDYKTQKKEATRFKRKKAVISIAFCLCITTIVGLYLYNRILSDNSVIIIRTTLTQTAPVEITTEEATTQSSHVFLPCEYR